MYLNEVKSSHNENLTDDYFEVNKTKPRNSDGPMILVKKGTTIIEAKREEIDRNERGKILETFKA